MSEMITVYCPRGCNIIDVPAIEGWDECASCGQIMRPEYMDCFYDVHERSLREYENRQMLYKVRFKIYARHLSR